MPQKTYHSGSGKTYLDDVNALHSESTLTESQRAVREALQMAYRCLGDFDTGRTVTASYSLSSTSCTIWIGLT